jgi:hypothetical protein
MSDLVCQIGDPQQIVDYRFTQEDIWASRTEGYEDCLQEVSDLVDAVEEFLRERKQLVTNPEMEKLLDEVEDAVSNCKHNRLQWRYT